MQKTATDGINVWFWGRGDPRVPSGIGHGWDSVKIDASWGMPDAIFPVAPSCDYASHFNAHEIIFDLTFCVSLSLAPMERPYINALAID